MFNLLKYVFNPIQWAELFTFYGGGKSSGGGGNSTSTSYSTNLPEYAKPYYQELLKQTGKSIFDTDSDGNVTGVKTPTNLPQQQVAGFTPLQQQTQQQVAAMQTPGQFAQSTAGLNTTQAMGVQAAGQGLNQAFGYNPSNTQVFGQGYADYYSNPYQQNVTNTALREAQLQGTLQKQNNMLGSIGRGTFGGARQALLQAEQERGVNQNLADIQYRGSADAFKNAQDQFNADQARIQQSQQYAASLGKDLGLAGLGATLDSSKALGALGAQQQETDLARLQAQGAVGKEQQTQSQQELDTQYQNAMAQENYQRQLLQYYSDILRGNAGALGSSQVQYAPAPSQLSQVAGLGLAGLGLYKALR